MIIDVNQIHYYKNENNLNNNNNNEKCSHLSCCCCCCPPTISQSSLEYVEKNGRPSLILFGGVSGDDVILGADDVYLFDIELNKWFLMNTYGIIKPERRCGHVSIAFKTIQNNNQNNNNSNENEYFIIKWKLLIFGGSGLYSFFNDLFILDIDSQTWEYVTTTGDIPPPIESPCSIYDRIRHRIMIAFGRWENGREHSQQYCLDLDERKWYRINNNNNETTTIITPESRYAPGGAGIEAFYDLNNIENNIEKKNNNNNDNIEKNESNYYQETEMWIFGGYSRHYPLTDLWRCYRSFNDNNNEYYKWEKIQIDQNINNNNNLNNNNNNIDNNNNNETPNVFLGHCVVSLRNRFIVVLSGFTVTHSWSNDIWVFDTQEYKWNKFTLGDHHPLQHRSSAVVTVDRRDACSVYLFGGVCGGPDKLNDLWKIDFSKFISLFTSDMNDMFDSSIY